MPPKRLLVITRSDGALNTRLLAGYQWSKFFLNFWRNFLVCMIFGVYVKS